MKFLTFLIWLWRWCNTPHCVCGNDDEPVCHKHEGSWRGGQCCMCKHLSPCHLLSGTTH
jgi:hypothetical protein